MDAERISIARTCLDAAHDGSLTFPVIVGTLIAAGFEGYIIDYRRNTQTFYLVDGDSIMLDMAPSVGNVMPAFDAGEIARLVRWAQAGPTDYSYVGFCEKAKQAGCAGYIVSFSGRRVLYFGRTGETHVEHFPN